MKRLHLLIIGLLILWLPNLASAGNADSKQILIDREIQAGVEALRQKQVLVVPADPLEFETTLNWQLTITKKGLMTSKESAYFQIDEIGTNPKQLEHSAVSGSGILKIPKGKQYQVTLFAGEYSMLLLKSGAEVRLKLNYTEAIVNYTPLDAPYQYSLEIQGPLGLDQWQWFWRAEERSSGKRLTHQFNQAGLTGIVVEGRGRTVSGVTSRKFPCELEVAPLIVLNPKVGPLQGPAELPVAVQVEAVVNYGQRAEYLWSFGNGIEIGAPAANTTYKLPGKYLLVLKAKVAGTIKEESWLVEVAPLTISPNAVVTPLTGPVPLLVSGVINPVIKGGPTDLKYLWEVAGETVAATSFKKSFTEPGDYLIRLNSSDQLHPELIIPEQVFLVKATPPQLLLEPTTSQVKGVIPLTVNFQAHLTVSGEPVKLIHHWNFGDGEYSYDINPQHVFKKPGEYQVELVVSDWLHPGNLAQAKLKLQVLPPEMKVSVSSNLSKGLIPLPVSFSSQLSVTGSPCEPQYRWDFGDGQISLEANPLHTFKQEGKYNVVLEVKDRLHPGNTVSTSLPIEVKQPKLRLTATVTPETGTVPLTVQCRAWADKEGSTEALFSYVWDFGDGTKAEGPEVSHTYSLAAVYTVQVSVVDLGLGLTERKSFKVNVKNPSEPK